VTALTRGDGGAFSARAQIKQAAKMPSVPCARNPLRRRIFRINLMGVEFMPSPAGDKRFRHLFQNRYFRTAVLLR
jgi:hypothetical protein